LPGRDECGVVRTGKVERAIIRCSLQFAISADGETSFESSFQRVEFSQILDCLLQKLLLLHEEMARVGGEKAKIKK